MRLLPAPAGSGIVFRRTDLDNFEIPAIGRNVAKVSYATSLMRQGVLISTTEHLLSALIGMGVDNVIVELDNLELPILDGSALPYVEAFLSVGIRTQRRRRETIRVLQAGGGARGQQVHRRLSRLRLQHPVHHRLSRADRPAERQHRSGRGDLRHDDCAGAHLWLQGRRAEAARHGPDPRRRTGERHHSGTRSGPENGPLRFADEYVRHKVLDLIGDLALAGRRIEGHVVAERAGHAMHTALVSRLLKDRSAWELAHVPVEAAPARESTASIAQDAAIGAPVLIGA